MDRIAELDLRNRDYPVTARLRGAVVRKSKVWRLERRLMGDQGQEGACVEFGLSHVLACLPVAQALAVLARIRAAHLVYWAAQRRDPWPGGSYPGARPVYEGTSELAGMQVLRDMGAIDGFDWAFGIDQAIDGVLAHGPANLALNWTEGLSNPRPDGLAEDDGRVIGGHDVALIGFLFEHRLPLDPRGTRRDLGVLAQSWGLGHGDGGRIYVPIADLSGRLGDDGTCAFLRGERRLSLAQLPAAG